MTARVVTIFLESINSKQTRENYLYYLKNFVEYYKLKDIASIITIQPTKLQEMIEDFVIHQKRKNLSKSYINGHKSALKALIETTDILINWRKIIRLMPEQGKKAGQRAWKREQIATMLKCSKKLKTRALILFLTCGCRIGAIPNMTLADMTDMPLGCKRLVVYRDTKDEYITFLTPEASRAFDEYLEKRKKDGEYIDKNTPLFRRSYLLGMQKVKPATRKSLHDMNSRIQHNAGLRDPTSKKNGRYDVATDHGFRKYFNTIMKTTQGVNRGLAEKMLGHNSKEIRLDTEYLDEEFSSDLSFNEFKKAISELTIDDSARNQAELKKERAEKTELQKKVNEIQELKEQMNDFNKLKQELREEFLDEIKNLKTQSKN